jgi:hypothetical protein
LDSVITIINASGELVSQQRYLPFGGVRTEAGTISLIDFGYTERRGRAISPALRQWQGVPRAPGVPQDLPELFFQLFRLRNRQFADKTLADVGGRLAGLHRAVKLVLEAQ